MTVFLGALRLSLQPATARKSVTILNARVSKGAVAWHAAAVVRAALLPRLSLPSACRSVFGANKYKVVPPKNFFALWFGNLQDPTLIMLMVAALVSHASRRQ